MPTVSMDSRAVTIDGRRTLLLSGAMHYCRSTPQLWPELLDRSREAGLNCIETYAMWEGHEHREGRYDFTDRFDLARFLRLCHERGLHVILRPGPYICSEWNFGGLPAWLLEVPDIALRTFNPLFLERVKRWFRVLMAQVGELQATRGGPIILVQLENEYKLVARRQGEAGRQYLAWLAATAREAGVEVPLIMCEGAALGAVETVNGFTAHDRIDSQKRKQPDAPVLWTELWPGWYDVWGSRHHLRDAGEIAYSVLRFIAGGGAGVNYYMWHGGTNFGRSAMYLQTTSYDFDAPLDEYGLPTAKLEVLARIHRALHAHADVLLDGDKQPTTLIRPGELGPLVLIERYFAGDRGLAFLINAGEEPDRLHYRGPVWDLPPKSVVVLADKAGQVEIACRSWDEEGVPIITRTMERREKVLDWDMLEEPVPAGDACPLRASAVVERPISQLKLTGDDTDYCWYGCTLRADEAREAELALRGGDILYVFVNGQFVAASGLPLRENRGSFDGPAYRRRFSLPLAAGENRVAILAVAVGLVKGDWMIDGPMETERKGLWGEVLLDGGPVAGPWTMIAGLVGERQRIWEPAVSRLAPWKPIQMSENPLRWYRTTFNATESERVDPAPWALDASGLNKGLAWINGQCLGRYWLLIARDEATDQLKNPLIQVGPAGETTQRYYHIPREWLRAENELVIFEEQGALPNEAHFVRRR